MDGARAGRLEQARVLSEVLLEDIELDRLGIPQLLMKCKRLARLLRDTDAETWMSNELAGYPDGFNFASLGTCAHYPEKGGRVLPDRKYWKESLPEIAARRDAAASALANLKFPSSIAPSISSANAYERTGDTLTNAINSLMASFGASVAAQKGQLHHNSKLIAGLLGAVHAYVSDLNISLSFGTLVESEFESVRAEVDEFIRIKVPKGTNQLLASWERMAENTDEARAQALLSCRRLLLSVADAVFPAQSEPYTDANGKTRDVGPDAYKNRILAYLEGSLSSASSVEVLESQMGHLASRLDTVNDKACKGVHADVSAQEARLVLLHTYLMIAEVARVPSPAT